MAQFDHAQSNSKKWPRGYKDQIAPNEFFSQKTTNKIFMYPFKDVPFLGKKWPICPEQIFFGTNHYYYFHLPIGPFHCAKFKKILTADPEL